MDRALFLLVLLAAGCAPAGGGGDGDPDAAPTVATEGGVLAGLRSGESLAFLGIPYAAPPVGPLRFRPPGPALRWAGVRDATAWGSACTQLAPDDSVIGGEDCLVLNVWTPAERSAVPLPVMVFVHGGSNVSGATSDRWLRESLYDGAHLSARGPAVVVTIQYRVGVMGFLADPSFAAEDEHGAAGTYGLLDQIAALGWVQRNAATFGGDPTRVLLFGQSAGAYDSCYLLTSPLAAGLFSRALLMSGGCEAGSAEDGARSARIVARRTRCAEAPDRAACFRALPAAELVAANDYFEIGTGTFYGGIVDGHVIPEQPMELLRTGRHNAMPLVIGSTTDEMSLFVWAYLREELRTEAQLRSFLDGFYGPALAARILAAYPAGARTPMERVRTLLGDEAFVCPARRIARVAAVSQTAPVRRYVFSHAFDNPELRPDGAAHGFDLFFAFGNLDGDRIRATPSERALADAMVAAFARFADGGDPNHAGLPDWPAYDVTTHRHVVFDTPIAIADVEPTARCDFWDDVYSAL